MLINWFDKANLGYYNRNTIKLGITKEKAIKNNETKNKDAMFHIWFQLQFLHCLKIVKE